MRCISEAKWPMNTFTGPLGFYKGVGPNVFGQAPAGAVKFAAFEGLSIWADRKLFETKKLGTNLKPLVDLGCAAIAFCVCSVVLVPGEVWRAGDGEKKRAAGETS